MKTIFETDSEFICDIQAPCFRNLSPDEMEIIREGKTQILFRRGDNLTKQGAFTSYVLFLIKGLAKQYLEGDGTRTFNMRIIRPGDFLGLSAVFQENIFGYSANALTDCQAYLIEKETLAKVIRQNGQFGFGLIRRYCEQNNNLLSIIGSLNYKQMNGRLAEILLYMDGLKTENHEIFQLLSRKDLADFAGISVESAVKLLKSFEKDGLIELHDKDIVLKKHETLAEISKRG
ncbi:MAG: Crp/Fnr family transcriptional regulator [Bacteroidales bacterium]|jgi:CRP/FNR family transcriptional regulator|nr:Crp/Fnr family transcriptional regulator [Bacteroidales bacterium]